MAQQQQQQQQWFQQLNLRFLMWKEIRTLASQVKVNNKAKIKALIIVNHSQNKNKWGNGQNARAFAMRKSAHLSAQPIDIDNIEDEEVEVAINQIIDEEEEIIVPLNKYYQKEL